MLVFGSAERGPNDMLRYQLETVSRLSAREQEVVRESLAAVIIKNQLTGAIARVSMPAMTAITPRAATTLKAAKVTTAKTTAR